MSKEPEKDEDKKVGLWAPHLNQSFGLEFSTKGEQAQNKTVNTTCRQDGAYHAPDRKIAKGPHTECVCPPSSVEVS